MRSRAFTAAIILFIYTSSAGGADGFGDALNSPRSKLRMGVAFDVADEERRAAFDTPPSSSSAVSNGGGDGGGVDALRKSDKLP
jgi:hypothetical protein